MALKAGYKGIKKCGPGLKYDNVNGILSLEGESSLKLDNLEDVAITTPLQGDVLIYDGEDWVNEQPDTDPTEDSANLVSSGGVYDALQARVDWSSYAKTGVHNLYYYSSLYGKSGTSSQNGITFTRYGDGTFSFNGKATADIYYGIGQHIFFPSGTYIKTGCPANGSSSTYYFGGDNTGNEYGSGVSFTVTDSTDCGFVFVIKNGFDTHEEEIFVKPKVTVPSDTSTEFTPYAMTNRQLTEAVSVIESTITTDTANITLDNDIKKVYKIGRIAFVRVRFTLAASSGTSSVELYNLPYKPLATYPIYSITKRTSPFENVAGCNAYIDTSNGKMLLSGYDLPAGTYDMTFSYVIQ